MWRFASSSLAAVTLHTFAVRHKPSLSIAEGGGFLIWVVRTSNKTGNLKHMALSDAARCNAKAKSTGKQCSNPAVIGSTKCRLHGGKTPKGIASPNFKHGRYSSSMPTELLNKYQDALADTELLDQRASIATIDALISTILPNLDTADNGAAWVAMKKLVADIRLAYKTENFGRLEKALDEMEDWANLRIKHYETIEETRVLLDTRRKHVETVEKLTLAGERAISNEQMMLLVSQILYTIQMVVTDRQQRNAIATELQKLISLPAGANSTD